MRRVKLGKEDAKRIGKEEGEEVGLKLYAVREQYARFAVYDRLNMLITTLFSPSDTEVK